MKRKFFLFLLLLVTTGSAFAQFEAGKKYISTSLSGLNLSCSSSEKFRLGLDLDGGYFFKDSWMVRGNVGYEHTRHIDDVRVGAGVRYYFVQNGLYLGAGAEYNHFTKDNNDVLIPAELGYAFFLNGHVTLEPALYCKIATCHFSDNTSVGLRVGLGFYF